MIDNIIGIKILNELIVKAIARFPSRALVNV